MKKLLTTAILSLLAACSNHLINTSDVSITIKQNEVQQYQPIVIDTALTAQWESPYNHLDVAVDLNIQTPSGKSLKLPAYYVGGESNSLSRWQFKFSPKEVGNYKVSVQLVDDNALKGNSKTTAFLVTSSKTKGFIESNNLWSFKYSNGEQFRGIGENFGWEARDEDDSKFFKTLHENKRFNYDTMLSKLSTQGANIFRTWMIYWNLPMEWQTVKNASRYTNDTNRFNASAIERMQQLIELTEKHKMKVILSLNSHAGFDEKAWKINSYNVNNGGPVATKHDFFTNLNAKNRYKDKLRFMVAKWSYSTEIAAWEFFNEIDNVMYSRHDQEISDDVIVNWHKEMSEYLSSIDPHDHLITTSISHRDVQGLFDVANIDMNQSHLYKVTDKIPAVIEKFVGRHNKPYFVGEFGAEWDWSQNFDNIKGEMTNDFKRGLWYGLFSPTPIMPLSWWWEYFDENGVTDYFSHVQFINQHMLAPGNGELTGKVINSTFPLITSMAVENDKYTYVYLHNKSQVTQPLTDFYTLSESTKIYDCETGQFIQSTHLNPKQDLVLVINK